jgi:uncharacterized membrane protein YbhN (UPF0104 family)/tRNA A-37 threonylcarbamoyl transferase component Bud32
MSAPDGARGTAGGRGLLLTSAEPGRRNRRTIDALALALAGFLCALLTVVAAAAPAGDRDLADAARTLLGWTPTVWRASVIGAIAMASLIVLEALLRRRWALLRDMGTGLALVAVAGVSLGWVVESHLLPADADVFGRWGYPEVRIAAVVAVISVAGPELIRPVRLGAGLLAGLAALGLVALGAALPSGVLGALALGLGVGALVRLVFGSAAGVPPVAVVTEALEALGVRARGLAPSGRQRIGAADYVAHDGDGRPLRVRVLGRDAQDTQRIAHRWRALAYRHGSRHGAVGRLEQVEHEALATVLAGQAGVRTPEVATAALGPEGDALLVTRQPDAEPLEHMPAGDVSDAMMTGLWAGVMRLHAAGIAHGRLHVGNVVVVDGECMIIDLASATLGAPASARDTDVAELLVSTAALVGPERALRAAVGGAGAPAVAEALPYLQPAALTPHTRERARAAKVGIADLRAAAAAAGGVEVPAIVPLRRFRARDLAVTALLALAAYLLISQLAKLGFETVVDELRQAQVGWVLVALLLAQLPLFAQGVSLRGAVATPLPLMPCVLLQSAMKVVNLTVPGSAGRIAVNVRFLQRNGAPTSEAITAGGVDSLSETLVQVLLVLMILPFVDLDVTGDLESGLPSGRLIGTIALVLALIVAVVMAVPALRAKVLPAIRPGLVSLRTVMTTRRKRLELFGGNIASEVLFALTLGAAAMAYGVDLTLAELLLVNMAASAISGLVPVPGGVGAQEAALTAGMVAVGVDESTAFAIAITHRLCTYFLPPIWGWFSLRWLRRSGYV